MAQDIERDLEMILGTGVNNTARVMELLVDKGWKIDDIMPVIYRALLGGKVDPRGHRIPNAN